MLYPNVIQACLLFDRSVDILETIARKFMAAEKKMTGAA
jgi:hypothetical protein